MWLIRIDTDGRLSLVEYIDNKPIPRYGILSHTWLLTEDEVTFKDMQEGCGLEKKGYAKITFCAEQAQRDGLKFFWVDTCCINKTSSADLSEAINSMYTWYRKSSRCYVYLSDVYNYTSKGVDEDDRRWKTAFKKSRWFTRGWTLQELIAPPSVMFFSAEGTCLGSRESLEEIIHGVTNIALQALRGTSLSQFSRQERLSWAANRDTGREEDAAYCLQGLFDVFMSPIYGEGREHALARLMEQIEKQDDTEISRLEAQQKEKMMKSLSFKQIHVRHTTIETAHAQTCRWLLSNSQFCDWLDPTSLNQHHGILWIKGKPGSGKSTLMKFALAHVQETLENSVVIHFFFNARGEEIERSTVGTYRALLLQLLDRIPELQCVLEPSISSASTTPSAEKPWGLHSLKPLLEQTIQTLNGISVVCFIDALDECEEQQIRDMVTFFERVSNLSLSPGTRFQVCLSSRHYPNITIQAGLNLVLEGQEGHTKDIIRYIQSELNIGKSKIARQIQDDLRKKASGVFMWVVLVVGILKQEYDHGHIHTLSRRLKEIPADLHELFRDILTRDSRDEKVLILCIQWILYARQPLRPEQLYYAVLAGVDPNSITMWDPEETSEDDISRFILDASKGLTALTSSANRVQFIHESVRDFLLKEDGLGTIWPALGTNLEGQSHERLKQCCLAYMSLDIENILAIREGLLGASPHEVEALRKSTDSKFPFLRHAVQNVLYHANQAEAAHIAQQGFLEDFPFIRWAALDGLFENNKARRFEDNVSSLYILASRNLSSLIEVHPSATSCFEVGEGRYGAPFLAAMATGSKEAVSAFIKALSGDDPGGSKRKTLERFNADNDDQFILPDDFKFPKRGDLVLVLVKHEKDTVLALLLSNFEVDVNAKDAAGRTAVVLAIQQGRKSVVEMLLSTGRIEVNAKNATGRTPLMWAIRQGRKDIVNLLLSTGRVEINAKDDYGWTPLMWAVQQARKDIIELLFSFDKVDFNTKSNLGYTPVMEAAANGYSSIVELLLSTGEVDIGVTNGRGESALTKAEKNGHGNIVQMLQSYTTTTV